MIYPDHMLFTSLYSSLLLLHSQFLPTSLPIWIQALTISYVKRKFKNKQTTKGG